MTRPVHALTARLARDRSRRVLVLLAGIVALSLADLAITLVHLQSVGMIEANPIAAYIIETTRSSAALTAFKLASVAVCVTLLFAMRRRVQGELAAWGAICILAWLSVHWHLYTEHLGDPAELRLAQTTTSRDGWLRLDGAGPAR